MITGAGGFFEGFSSSYEIESTLPQNVSSESEAGFPPRLFVQPFGRVLRASLSKLSGFLCMAPRLLHCCGVESMVSAFAAEVRGDNSPHSFPPSCRICCNSDWEGARHVVVSNTMAFVTVSLVSLPRE